MAIQVVLQDHTGNVSTEAKMADDAPVNKLIPAVVTAMGLPITDLAGRPMTYHISHDGRQLQEEETLQSAGVQSGGEITLVPEMTAGTGFLATRQQILSPLVEIGPIIRELKPVSGFPYFADQNFGGEERVHVEVDSIAMVKIWQHCQQKTDCEMGGLLLGTVYEEMGRFFVQVQDILEADFTLCGATHLTFTGATWLHLLKDRHKYQELCVLGWYHSHPDLGIFLSYQDIFTHRSFFQAKPWYIALVVDPVTREWGVFTWDGDQIVRQHDNLTH